MRKIQISKNQKYGKLKVVKELKPRLFLSGQESRVFLCKCSCGNSTKVQIGELRNGGTKSCGCSLHKSGETKGGITSVEYTAWCSAKQRCNNRRMPFYKNYGGRGIKHKLDTVSDLLNDIGRRPTSQHSLDRVDNNGHYEIGNIRWATRKEQQNNTRRNL